MNLDDLGKSFEANKVPILATAGAGVVAFALLQRRKTAAASAAPPQGVTTTGGVYSAGGQTAGASGVAAYDSSASDVYGLVQPQLESLGQQVTGLSAKLNAVPVSQAPPVASTLFGPRNTGQYASYQTGIYEVENDGSLYHLSGPEWSQVIQARGGDSSTMNMGGAPAAEGSYAANLAAKINAAPVPKTA